MLQFMGSQQQQTLRWALIPPPVPLTGARDRHVQVGFRGRDLGEAAVCRPKKGASGETSAADTHVGSQSREETINVAVQTPVTAVAIPADQYRLRWGKGNQPAVLVLICGRYGTASRGPRWAPVHSGWRQETHALWQSPRGLTGGAGQEAGEGEGAQEESALPRGSPSRVLW